MARMLSMTIVHESEVVQLNFLKSLFINVYLFLPQSLMQNVRELRWAEVYCSGVSFECVALCARRDWKAGAATDTDYAKGCGI